MYKRKTISRRFCVISVCFILTATAEKLPPPVDGEYLASETAKEQAGMAEKIVKVKFNRIYYINKMKSGQYGGNLRSRVKPKGETYYENPGVQVQFPPEAFEFFSKYVLDPGAGQNDVSGMIKDDRGEVYVQFSGSTKKASKAVGDVCEKNGDETEYRWSTDAKIPDLADQDPISASDLVLFPEQLNGKIVEIEFYETDRIEQKSAEEYSGFISCGQGHISIAINFTTAGKPFFQKIADRPTDPQKNKVYAKVNINDRGVVTLEAKGRRISGSGIDAEYRW